MSTTPASRPQKKSNFLWWVLGLLLAGIVILGVGGLVVVSYFAKHIQVQQTSHKVEIGTPAGELKVSKDPTPNTGLPVYPGAILIEPGATVELTPKNDEAVEVTAARYRTADPLDKVDTWYRERLGPDFKREGPGISGYKKDVFGVEVKSDDIAFLSEKNDLVLVVAIQKRGMGVEIALVRIGKEEAQ